MYEYDNFEPVALIELKCKASVPAIDLDNPQMRAHCNLARRAALPLFVVYHDNELTRFQVHAGNRLALEALGTTRRTMGDESYVRFLYSLRDRELPASWRECLQAGRAAAGLEAN